jgi:hypothetical protein
MRTDVGRWIQTSFNAPEDVLRMQHYVAFNGTVIALFSDPAMAQAFEAMFDAALDALKDAENDPRVDPK